MRQIAILCLCLTLVWASPFHRFSKSGFLRSIDPRIINGDRALEGQFPWQVGLRISGAAGNWFCGGTLIDEQWVLTTGHCIDEADSATVIAGVVELDDENAVRAESDQFIVNEGYDQATLLDDIGLIKLSEPLELSENVQPIAIAEWEVDEDAEVIVSGWGTTNDDGTQVSNTLNYARLWVISNRDCQEWYGDAIVENMVCAVSSDDEPVKSPCNGDSGGPVIVEDREPKLVAVISFISADGCETDAPSGYVRVAPYLDWIQENIENPDDPNNPDDPDDPNNPDDPDDPNNPDDPDDPNNPDDPDDPNNPDDPDDPNNPDDPDDPNNPDDPDDPNNPDDPDDPNNPDDPDDPNNPDDPDDPNNPDDPDDPNNPDDPDDPNNPDDPDDPNNPDDPDDPNNPDDPDDPNNPDDPDEPDDPDDPDNPDDPEPY